MMQYIMNIISDMLCSNMLWSSGLGREVHNISHLVVWVISPQHRVTSIATAFGPPNFQMEITPLTSK